MATASATTSRGRASKARDKFEPSPDFVAAMKPRNMSETSISGTVTHLYHQSESFCAGVLSAAYDENSDPLFKDCRFCVRDSVSLGEKVTFRGAWEETKYGRQFVAERIEYPQPDTTTPHGLAHYLATTEEFYGIGPAKAQLIAEAFSSNFDEVIRDEPERVAEVGKLTLEQALLIQSVWCERSDINAISAWLGEYGLTANQIRKIAKAFGNKARAVLTERPYTLHEKIDGIGFQRNDEIALKMGIEPNSPQRIRAALVYLVNQAHDDTGHTYIPKAELIALTIKSLYLDDLDSGRLIAEQIDLLATEAGGDKLIILTLGETEYVGDAKLYEQEHYVYDCLTQKACALPIDISGVNPAEVGLDSLTEEQVRAVVCSLTAPVTIITGGAGTGKSHTIKCIVNTLRRGTNGPDGQIHEAPAVHICAPTGKAARRLQADGIYAQTIHRTLEYSPRAGGFQINEHNKLVSSAVIVDEVSMCSIPLLYALCKGINFNRTRLILVGDYNQLPPIGPGNTLRDFTDNELVPVRRLTKCHRNAGKLKENCVAVLDGKLTSAPAEIDPAILPANVAENTPAWSVINSCMDTQRVVELLCILQAEQFAKWGYNPLTDCQIITPQRPGPLGVNRLNLELQRVEQAKRGVHLPAITDPNVKPELRIGDKVMQTSNNYELNLMNGTQGIIQDIIQAIDPKEAGSANGKKLFDWYVIQFDDRDELLQIRKDENKLVLAYAVTVHKVQGSQYPCVVSVVHRTHSYMLSRNLLYTSVSRARYTSVLLGEPVGMNRAAHTITNMERRTWTSLFARSGNQAHSQNSSGGQGWAQPTYSKD